jgi:F0F1-type ATP synthase membrane subunit b/b'
MLTYFIPVFVVAFALFTLLLIFVVIVTLVLQFKKYRRVKQLKKRRVSIEEGSSPEYIKVSTLP